MSNYYQPFFSIITPVHNWWKTIKKTIDSVLSQSYKNFEYIIVDAMSDDETEKIVSSYWNQIIYVREPDKGLYDAMNKWINFSSGEIIGIINSDDFYLPDVFDHMLSAFRRLKNVDIFHWNIFDVQNNWTYFESKPYPISLMYYWMCIKHPTCFVKKKVYEEIGLFNISYKIAADYDFLLRAYLKGFCFNYLDRTIVSFSRGGASDTNLLTGSCEQLKIRKSNLCKNSILAYMVFLYWLCKPIMRKIFSFF